MVLGKTLLKRFRDASEALGFQLGLAVGISVLFACMLVTAGVMLRMADKQHMSRTTEVQAYANVLAAGVANALADENTSEVTRTLNAISTARGIEFAAVYDLTGKQIAGIGMQAVLLEPEIASSPDKLAFLSLFDAQTITAEAAVRKAGRDIGFLRVAGELPSAGAAFMDELKNAMTWTALAGFIGMVIGLIFQRRIVRPLRQLTQTIAETGSRKRLPRKFSFHGRGEIGVLAGAYNGMISEIAARESELTDYKLHLEELVDVRTAELRLARDEAEAATQTISRFLATMSHEIRTPMNGLLVMAELLERSSLPAREARHASTIARSGRSLMHLLNDVMDFSKLEAGKIELEAIEMSPDRIVGDCVGLFWEQARSKQLEMTAYVAPDVPRTLIGDPTRIGQCLANLVGNAIKFTESGHVSITVQTDGPGALTIAVRDTGPGIPEDRLSLVFEAFAQADQSTTRRHGGTGLGLSICAQLVEAMGGEIKVESTIGAGSCFAIRIPLNAAGISVSMGPAPHCIAVRTARPALRAVLEQALADRGIRTEGVAEAVLVDTDDLDAPYADAPHVGLWQMNDELPEAAIRQRRLHDVLRVPFGRDELEDLLGRIAAQRLHGVDLLRGREAAAHDLSVPDLHRLRILVADDSAVNREVISEALEVYGIVPAIAQDGSEALTLLTRTAFDIAFIDGEMPHLDGFEVARRARAAGVTARLVLFSAHSGLTSRLRGTESGFDEALPKPFHLDTLKDLLLRAQSGTHESADEAPADDQSEMAPGTDVLDGASLESLYALEQRRPGAMRRVLDRLIETLPGAVSRLELAVKSGNCEETRQAAHALKSICMSVGAGQLGHSAAALEQLATGRADWPEGGKNEACAIGERLKWEADLVMNRVNELHDVVTVTNKLRVQNSD